MRADRRVTWNGLGRSYEVLWYAVGPSRERGGEKVGGEGIITVEESKTTETTLDVVEGMQFDRGFVSPYFITNPDRAEAVLEDAYVWVSDGKIGAAHEIVPLMEDVAKAGRPILLIAEEIEDPFGTDTNDLPTPKMAANIKKHVEEVL